MGKRSNRARVPKDAYLTIDRRAVPPVIPFLQHEGIRSFIEPCWGWGHVVGPLTRAGLVCRGRYDLEPKTAIKVDPDLPGRQGHVIQRDGRALTFADLNGADAIVTNPPWSWKLLHELIMRWSRMVPTWLLFYGNWIFSERAAPIIRQYMTDFVPLPRLQWFPGTDHAEKDSCGWYRFHMAEAATRKGPPRIWPRGADPSNDNFLLSEAIGA
ncbi:hypothetical protein IWQ55_006193 [Labrenzia sp. EL_208]|nr:hypothetical protein [Labrenzia sp. EL_132]MBG6211541.1 hypothetical protein [Labrenzia sp. EL_126]MBG6232959.1 hypothetical protein [Labrenzia sp. EL_208]